MATPAIAPEAGARPTDRGWAAQRRLAAARSTPSLHNRKATAGVVLLLIIAFVAAFPGLIAHDDPSAAIYDQQAGSSAAHLLGTTQVGQDVFAQLVWGTRLTLIITVVVGLLSTAVSILIGVTAGYLGGMADRALSLLTDVFLIIPTLPLLIILAAYLTGAGTIAIIGALVGRPAGHSVRGRCAPRRCHCGLATSSKRRACAGNAAPTSSSSRSCRR